MPLSEKFIETVSSGGENRSFLALGHPGYEEALRREMTNGRCTVMDGGEGWIRVSGKEEGLADPCFPFALLHDPQEIAGDSANALARQLGEWFAGSCRAERFDAPWPRVFFASTSVEGLGQRAKVVEAEFSAALRQRMSRVARLAVAELPRGTWTGRGLWVHCAGHRRMFAARTAWLGGQRRMADDPAAPSRSYLKVEEAFAVLGQEPVAGETVVDLGAAPGGWTYSAAKRGASVVAVDNGPLKGGAAGHPGISHLREDAFRFAPAAPVDWLFCDLVEEPHHVLRKVREWLERRWCRRFVATLKFGRADPLELLAAVRSAERGVAGQCSLLRVRHLYHNREEITLVGAVRAE